MEHNQLRKNLWNGAAKAGLALGGVSSVYLFASQFMTAAGMSGFLSGLFSLLLWAAKFGGCIWLMKFFMKKFASENGNVQNSTLDRRVRIHSSWAGELARRAWR